MALQVELVSPERVLFSGEAEMIIARTVGGGDIAFMDGHAPFVGALEVATATIAATAGDEEQVAVHGGFIEVTTEPGAPMGSSAPGDAAADATAGTRTVVTILSDVAELSGEIDVARARQAMDRAQQAQQDRSDSEAEAALRRANVRLAAADAL